ncbi:MAG: MFS transporter [Oscillospiraceae bacterium]|nr:MFS transporter [Oscillospiraceae bacterium]
MARKELGLDSMGIQKTMRFKDYFGDGIGQLPLNAMSCLVAQLTYFYTEKVGLAAGAVATMLLIAKICDAFSDLVMGKIMDKVNSPKGKCRPWFLWMLAPTVAIIVLMFTVPRGVPSGVQMAYVLITNILISAVIYTAIAIPYGSIMAVRTESVEERGKMGIARTIFGYMTGMIITILIIPVTNMLGPNGVADQAAWIKVAVIFAVLSGVSLYVLYRASRENADVQKLQTTEKQGAFLDELKLLFQNKYWVLMLIAMLFVNISYGLSASGGTYYAKYILGNDNIVALLGAIGLIPTFLGFILVGPLTRKFGMAKTCFIGCVIGAVACIARVFTPYSFWSCIIGGAFQTFATMPIMCVGGAMVNNCVEYNEWKFGKRMLGMSNSANSFGAKVGSGIGGSLIGWLLAAAGYQAAAASQPASVNTAIFAFAIYIPLALFIIMGVMFKRYDLEKIYPQIVEELRVRRAENADVE